MEVVIRKFCEHSLADFRSSLSVLICLDVFMKFFLLLLTTLSKPTGYSCRMTTKFNEDYSKPFCIDHQGLIGSIFVYSFVFFHLYFFISFAFLPTLFVDGMV